MAITVINLSDAVSTWVTKTNTIATNVGDLALLSTGDSDVVKGVNTVDSNIGTLSALNTVDKSDLVSAINEVYSLVDSDLNDSAEILALMRSNLRTFSDSSHTISFDSSNGQFSIDSDTVTSALFKSGVTLLIKDSAGTVLKTMHSPGE